MLCLIADEIFDRSTPVCIGRAPIVVLQRSMQTLHASLKRRGL